MIDSGPYAHFFASRAESPRPDTRRIPQDTIPSLAARLNLIPTHLKIDIEGYEVEALQGAGDFLHAVRPVLFLELHCALIRDRGLNPATVLAHLAGRGYTRLQWRGRPISADEAVRLEIARRVCLPD
jgi:hypothetical protein